MDQRGLAPAGSFCWNHDCPEYAQVGHHNIRKFGQTARGGQRYQCKTCKKTSTETKGTVFHCCHHSQQTILDCLAMLADRNSLAAIHRIKGVKEETVCEWLQRAARHMEEMELFPIYIFPLRDAIDRSVFVLCMSILFFIRIIKQLATDRIMWFVFCLNRKGNSELDSRLAKYISRILFS